MLAMLKSLLAGLGKIFGAMGNLLTASMQNEIARQQIELDTHKRQLELLEVAFKQRDRTIEIQNEMIVGLRLRIKEVRDECIADGLEVKQELTDVKQRMEKLTGG